MFLHTRHLNMNYIQDGKSPPRECVWLTTCNIANKILNPPLLKEYGYIYSTDIFRSFFLSFFSSWWRAMWNTVSLVCEKQWHRCSIIKPRQSLPAGVWNVQCSSTVQHVLGAVWERVAAGQTCVFPPPCASSELCSLTAVALMTGVAARYRDIQEALKALCGHRCKLRHGVLYRLNATESTSKDKTVSLDRR